MNLFDVAETGELSNRAATDFVSFSKLQSLLFSKITA